jgi:hypothetical protein
VLFRVNVGIAELPDGAYSPMARADYTLLIGTSAALGPEVSHEDAWHTIAPGGTALIKVSPLERPANTGRHLRVRVDVRSFESPAVGVFLAEPRVIMSRAGSAAAILKVLGDRPAVDARAVGQRWEGALARPKDAFAPSLASLAKALYAAATRATVRKAGKRGGCSRRAADASSDSDGDFGPSARGVAEADDDAASSDDTGSTPPAPPRRDLAGSKRSAAAAQLVTDDAAPRARLTSGTQREAPPKAAPADSEEGAPSACGSLLPLVEADDGMAPAAPPPGAAAAAAPPSPPQLDYETSLALSCLLEDDEHLAAAATAAVAAVAAAAGGVPQSSSQVAPPAPAAPRAAAFPPVPVALVRSLSQNLELFCPSFSAGRTGRGAAAMAASASPARGLSALLPLSGVSPLLCSSDPQPQHWGAPLLAGSSHEHPAFATGTMPSWPPALSCSPVFSL